MLTDLTAATDPEAAAFFADARTALAPMARKTLPPRPSQLILGDLSGMPDGPHPNPDLVSDWSLKSFDIYFNNAARHTANTFARKATETEATGRWVKRWHKSRQAAVLALLAAAEEAALPEDRPWHAARLDTYAELHGLRGWYRSCRDGKHRVHVNLLRRREDGDRGRYFVSPSYALRGGMRPSSVVDRDSGEVVYRAINQRIAEQWIEEKEA